MNDVIKYEIIESKIIDLKGQKVILDSDVAQLYGVETKRVNEAIKNNPDKFPHASMFEISESEFADLRSKYSTTKLAR